MRRRPNPDSGAQRGEEGGERDGAAPVTTRDLDTTTRDLGVEVPLETDADTSSIATLPLREDAGALTAVELARHLEQENAAIQRNLRLASEQYDAVTEELKASNEEMQATNEELSTINYELKARVEELTTTNSYLSNFLGATDTATLFLDRVLNIKRFTSAALALFNLIPSDIGRPLAHVTNRLDYPTLEDDAKEVLARLIPIERETITSDSLRHLVARLLPYRSLDDRIEGVVVTFMDITARKQAEEEVRRAEARQSFLLELGDAIRPLSDPLEIQRTVMCVLGEHLQADRVLYSEIETDDRHFVITDNYVRGNVPKVIGRFPLSDYDNAQKSQRRGETLVLPDIRSEGESDEHAAFLALGVQAVIGVPLHKDGRWVATLSVHQGSPRQWSPEETALVSETAERTWAAVEHARAEEALARSEAKYHTLFDSIDQGFCLLEVLFDADAKPFDYRFVEINKAFEQQSGLVNAVGKTILELVPDLEPQWVEQYGKVARSGEAIRFEADVVSMNYIFDIYAFPSGVPSGNLVAVLFSDITERKRREANLVFLAETSADFSPLFRAEDIMERVGSRLADHLDLSRCNFSIIDEEADSIECIYAWRRDDSMPDVSGAHRISSFLSEEGRWHYAAGNFVVINDVRNNSLLNPAILELYNELGLRSIIDAPYLKDGRWKFQLTAARSEACEWRTDEIELVRELAERIYIRIERAYAEEALQQSESRFRMLGEAVPMGLWMADAVGKPIYQNPAWHQYTGMTSEELAVSGWEVLHHPEDISWLRQLWEEGVQQGKPIELEVRMRRHDGVYRWFACRTVPVEDEQGRIVKWVGSGLDIEEQKRAQQSLVQSTTQLMLVTDAAPVYIAQCDREARFKFVNRPYAQRFGLTVAECIGKRIPEVIGEVAYASFSAYIEKVLQGEAVEFDVDVHYEAIGRHFMHCSYVPEFGTEGKVTGFVSATSDITERKRVEETLSERNQEVETLNRRLQWAMTEIHHRVKNNLQIILAFIDIRRNAEEEMIPMSELARLSGNVRALSIIHDILTQEAKSGSDQETLSAKAVLDRLIQGLEQTTGGRSLSSTIEDVLLASRQTTALAIVTNELVSNALKHGKGQMEITFRVNDSYATLVLYDDGPGFPKDFNAETAANTGLELVDNIAKWDLQGQIVYDNRPEGGARITVTFPLTT